MRGWTNDERYGIPSGNDPNACLSAGGIARVFYLTTQLVHPQATLSSSPASLRQWLFEIDQAHPCSSGFGPGQSVSDVAQMLSLGEQTVCDYGRDSPFWLIYQPRGSVELQC